MLRRHVAQTHIILYLAIIFSLPLRTPLSSVNVKCNPDFREIWYVSVQQTRILCLGTAKSEVVFLLLHIIIIAFSISLQNEIMSD